LFHFAGKLVHACSLDILQQFLIAGSRPHERRNVSAVDDPGRTLRQIVFGRVGINQHFAGPVLNVEFGAVHVRAVVLPSAVLAGFIVLNFDLIEAARRVGDGTGNRLIRQSLPAHLHQSHGNAPDGHAGGVGDDLEFTKYAEAF
jgi:hypothetical protein